MKLEKLVFAGFIVWFCFVAFWVATLLASPTHSYCDDQTFIVEKSNKVTLEEAQELLNQCWRD